MATINTGSGAGPDPIEIEIDDKVDPKVASNIRDIAAAAREADDAILRMRAQLTGIDASDINKVTKAIQDQNKAYLDQENALNKAVRAEQQAVTAYNNAQTAQQKLGTEIQRTNTQTANAETALTRAVVAEEAATKASVDRSAALVAEARAQELAVAKTADMAKVLAQHTGLGATFNANGAAPTSAANSAFAQETKELTALGAAQSADIATQQRFIKSLTEQSTTLGMSKSEILAYRAAQLGMTEEAGPMIAKIKAAEEAENAAGGATGGLSQRLRYLFEIAREGGRGDYARLTGTSSLLAQSFGLLDKLATPAGAAVAAAALAIGGLLFAEIKGEAEQTKFNNTLLATGNYAGLTADSYTKMADKIKAASNGTIGTVHEALNALLSTGKASNTMLANLGGASVRLSELTGEDAGKIAADFLKMKSGVTAYAIEFNSQYHILSAAQIDYIRQLETQGQKEQAEEALSKDVYTNITKVGSTQLGLLEQGWKDLRDTASGVWEYLKDIGKEDTAVQRLDEINAKLLSAGQALTGVLAHGGIPDKGLTDLISNLTKEHATWQEIVDDQDLIAKKQADNAANTQKGVEASQRLNEQWERYSKNASQADIEIKKFKDDVAAALKVNPNDVKALQDQANMTQMIANIRKQFDPQDAKAAALAQRQAADIEAVNKKLRDETDEYKLLKPAQEAKQELDRIEESLMTKKINLEDKNNAAMVKERATVISLIGAKLAAKEINQEENKLYEAIINPMKQYALTLAAIQKLQAQPNGLTGDQAMEQKLKALNTLLTALHLNYGQVYTQEQKTEDVTKSLATIFDSTVGTMRKLVAEQAALDIAFQKGYITEERFKLATQQTIVQWKQLQIDMGKGTFMDGAIAGLGKFTKDFKGMIPGLENAFGDFLNNIAEAVGTTFAEIAKGQESLGKGFEDLAINAVGDFIGALVKLGMQWLATQAIAALIGDTSTTESGIQAAALAAAWAPAAISASIATLGGADAAGLSAYLAALAAGQIANTISGIGAAAVGGAGSFASGGYTGNISPDQIAGIVHGREFVVNAQATTQNRALLEAINAGRSLQGANDNLYSLGANVIPFTPHIGATQVNMQMPRIVIEQHGIQKMWSVHSWSMDEIRMIADDSAMRQIGRNVPRLMQQQIADPNSKVSRELTRRTYTKRRRTG